MFGLQTSVVDSSSMANLRVYALLATLVPMFAFASGCAPDDSPQEVQLGQIQAPLTVADCPAGYNVIEGTDGDDVLVGTDGND